MCIPLVVDWTTNYTAGLRQQVSRMKEKKKNNTRELFSHHYCKHKG